ncbi:glycine receptor subunit alpha-3-like isoform X2 [Macrobrachium nipponense]|uniref:glycine receptor subunit alpha-3-like isoform X2 n=1 Tax=Macrobrachium nipponense TaxID=159736 RepID=UPI0030C8A370
MVPSRFYFGLVLLSFSAKRTATETIHEYRSSRRYPGLGNELLKLDQLFRVGHRGQYDRRQTPAAALGIPTRVQIEMYIRSFGSVNPIQMEYTVDLYLHQRWLEVRFLNNTLTRPLDLSDPILVKMLWKPEVYFPNAKDSDFQYVTVPNVMLRIHPDGSILYILRLKLTFSCMMDLSHYPLDKQTCYIQLASFVKTTRELELEWYEDPLKMYKNLKLPQFQIKGLRAETCTQSFHIVSYVKALDIWMGSCTAFVFLALVEFTAVTHLARHHRRFVFWDSHQGQRAYVYNPSRARQREAQMHSKKSDREMSFHPSAASGSDQKYTMQRKSPIACLNSQATDDRRRAPVTNTGCVDENDTSDSGSAKPTPDQLRDRQADSSRLIHLYHTESSSIVAYNRSERVYGVDYPRTNSGRRRDDSDLATLPFIWQEKAATAKKIDVASRVVFPALFLVFNVAYWTYYYALS